MIKNDPLVRLRSLCLFVGGLFAIFGAITTGITASSYSASLFDLIVASMGGLLISIGIAGLLPLAAIMWRHNISILAIIFGLVWLCSTPFSVFTHFAAFSEIQAKRYAASLPAQEARKRKERASESIQLLQEYGVYSINDTELEVKAIEKRISELKLRKSQCPANHFKNCINPLDVKIDEEGLLLASARNKLSNTRKLNAAKEEELKALSDLSNSGRSGLNTVAPGFAEAARMSGNKGADVQNFIIIFMSTLIQILGDFAFMVSAVIWSISVRKTEERRDNGRDKIDTQNYTYVAPLDPRTKGRSAVSDEKNGWYERGYNVGDFYPCDREGCDNGFTIEKNEPRTRRFCGTPCRVQHNKDIKNKS